MRIRTMILTIALGLFLMAGCSENPTAVEEEDGHEDLSVELSLSDDHIHTLSPITFTVAVHDAHGAAFTAFDTLRVERQVAGEDTWRATDLIPSGGMFTGEYMFMSSGSYHLRVAGRTHDHGHMEVLHAMHEPIEVARAHEVAGGYRVEFENYPGHVHEGQEATMKFWILEAERDDDGVRAPIEGLEVTINCEDASGKQESHTPEESEPGVYEATHTFDGNGEAHLSISYPGTDGEVAEADFHIPVAHGH
ncbi:MAG: hypothetical protein WD423_06820 [Rhodothermales bacterium]